LFMDTTTLLIISNDKTLTEKVRKEFSATGINLEYAEDGISGLNKAREKSVGYIILDSEIPKCNGFIVCRLLMFDEKHKHLSIVITSDDTADEPLALRVGAKVFVNKNTDPQNIISQVRQMITTGSRENV